MNSKNTFLPVQTTLQSRGRLLDISRPVAMGILNATPDSFYNKGRDSDTASLLRTAAQMLEAGASLLDVGGASSKPGSELIDVETERQRVIPLVKIIHTHFPEAWISVDTYHARVAAEAVDAGAAIINDISSGTIDPDMIPMVAELKVPYIAMHMRGTPATMQQDLYYDDVTKTVRDYLRLAVDEATGAGITDVLIDPGFGFGKTVAHNFQLLRELHTFRICGKPVLAGLSRKSIICRTLQITPEEALNGTTALNMYALMQGASILRVHDVQEAVETIRLWEAIFYGTGV